MNIKPAFYLICLITLGACDKELKTIEFEPITFEGDAPIRSLESFGDNIVAVGGEKDGMGFIAVADIDLLDFQVIHHEVRRTVYSAEYFLGRYWFGLDIAQLNYAITLDQLEPYYFNEKDWVGSLYQHPIRKMERVGGEFFAIAGGQLTKGVIYQSSDSTRSWNPIEIDHELRAICSVGDSMDWQAWVGGNGILLTKSKGEGEWDRIDLEDIFIVDLVFEDHDLGWLVTYDGRIMKTKNGGKTWDEVHKAKGQRFVNRMRYANGHFMVVAQDGLWAHSTDGESWQWYDLETNQDLLDVWIGDEQFIVGTEMGEVYRISFSNL